MKRRLPLAVALIGHPQLLILDEPTVGLDPRQRIRIWDQLRELNSQGTAILVTTHVMEEAESCEHVALLSNVSILSNGTPEDIRCVIRSETLETAMLYLLNTQPEGGLR